MLLTNPILSTYRYKINCDFSVQDGRIVVADRSNNRVQLFLANGSFYFKFGTEGRGNGQFNKPASVACDSRYKFWFISEWIAS